MPRLLFRNIIDIIPKRLDIVPQNEYNIPYKE